jgi:type I restriction enzyme R subunit
MLKYLTDLIPIVKYEYGISKQIIPFSETVSTNFQKWTFQKNRHKAGEKINPFSEEQMEWLRLIKEFIAMNGSMTLDAFNYGKFADKGGGVKYYRLFGNDYQTIIDELNLALVA